MQSGQQLSLSKMFVRSSRRQRVRAGILTVVVVGLFGVFHLAATGRIQLDRWVEPCGFKQRYGFPCPTCGMTTSVLAFARGRILDSFYIQPVAGLVCSVMVIAAFLALPCAVFGVHFAMLDLLFSELKLRYVIVGLVVVLAAGWAVTLARAVVARAG